VNRTVLLLRLLRVTIPSRPDPWCTGGSPASKCRSTKEGYAAYWEWLKDRAVRRALVGEDGDVTRIRHQFPVTRGVDLRGLLERQDLVQASMELPGQKAVGSRGRGEASPVECLAPSLPVDSSSLYGLYGSSCVRRQRACLPAVLPARRLLDPHSQVTGYGDQLHLRPAARYGEDFSPPRGNFLIPPYTTNVSRPHSPVHDGKGERCVGNDRPPFFG
jgi:hypothetical protein